MVICNGGLCKSHADDYVGMYGTGEECPACAAIRKGGGKLNFGQAIEALKAGKKVSREGWNGKSMYLFYVPHWSQGTHAQAVSHQPFIAMFTAQATVVPWLASQTDMLAEDWQVVE